MSKPLATSRLAIDVMREVAIGGQTYPPGRSLVAQAADPARQRWIVGPALGIADAIVELDELLRSRAKGQIIIV